MNYWFAYRVYDRSIDISPGSAVLEGPYESYEKAKEVKISIRGSDIQKTSIFKASSEEEANEILKNETWMV